MKIAIITSGILPVPAVQGGAVENLIDFYLEYNNIHKLHDITIYSAFHPDVNTHPALRSDVNHYKYINTKSYWFRLCSNIYRLFHKNDYYIYQIEFFYLILQHYLSQERYDAIVLENRPGFAIKIRKKNSGIPIYSHIHTNVFTKQTDWTSSIFAATTRFICVSNYIKNEIYSLDRNVPSIVVYNGIDTNIFQPIQTSPLSRTLFGFNDQDFIVVFHGRLYPEKGLKELLQAMKILKSYSIIKLLVIGSTYFADTNSNNPFMEDLHNIAKELENKVFFTGFVPYHKLPQYLMVADVAVIPSHINEAFGMACIEAAAMGLPIITTNDGGIPEAVEGQKYIMIDKDSDLPVELANAILNIQKNYNDYLGNKLNSTFTKKNYANNFFNSITY